MMFNLSKLNGALLFDSQGLRFLPASFREMVCVIRLAVRSGSGLWGTVPPVGCSVLHSADHWQLSFSVRCTREVGGAVHLHSI